MFVIYYPSSLKMTSFPQKIQGKTHQILSPLSSTNQLQVPSQNHHENQISSEKSISHYFSESNSHLETQDSTPNMKKRSQSMDQSRVVLLPTIFGGQIMRHYVKNYLQFPHTHLKTMKRLSQKDSQTKNSSISEQSNENDLFLQNQSNEGSLIEVLSKLADENSNLQKQETFEQLQKKYQTFMKLGQEYWQVEQFQDSITYFQKGLEIVAKVRPQNSMQVGIIHHKIGLNYWKLKKMENAVQYYLNALQVFERDANGRNIEITSIYSNMAFIYQQQKNYQKAIEYLSKAIDNRRLVLPQIHPQISHNLNNKALLEWRKGDYREAIHDYGQALRINQKVYGYYHPEVARNHYNMALCLFDMKEYGLWLDYHYQSLRIMKVLGQSQNSDYIFWLKWFKIKLKELIQFQKYTKDLIMKSIGITTVLFTKDEQIQFLQEMKGSMEMLI